MPGSPTATGTSSPARMELGVIQAFAGQDEITGDREYILRRLQSVLKDPKGKRCAGFCYLPELNHHDTMYGQLMAKMAWRPEGLTLKASWRTTRCGATPGGSQGDDPDMTSLCDGVKPYEWTTTYLPTAIGTIISSTQVVPCYEQEEPVRKALARVAESTPHMTESLDRRSR